MYLNMECQLYLRFSIFCWFTVKYYWYVFAIISSTVEGKLIFYNFKSALSRLFSTNETCFINNWINFIETKSAKKHF